MNKSYHRKLFAAFLVTVLTFLALLTALGYYQFKNYYLQSLEARLVKEAYLVADMSQFRVGDNGLVRSYQEICLSAARDASTRVTIVNSQGVVLGDSQVSPEQLDNHNSRPEVYAALQGETGVEIRYSDTLQMDMLYVAVPYSNHGDVGAVRMAMSLSDLQAIYDHALLGILMAALVCGLLAFLFSFLLIPYFSRPIREITAAVEDMAGGNYDRRIFIHSEDELGILAGAINDMGQHIEQNLHKISEVKNRLEAILSNTVNGIVLIGQEGRLIYANPAAVSLLGIEADSLGRKYTETITAFELLQMIDEARQSLQQGKRSIVLHSRGDRTAEVNVVPVVYEGEAGQDILLVLNDISEMKRLEQVRRDFVANVSHELKTPVATISGFAETLWDEEGRDPANVAEFSRIIFDEAQRLSRLISGLLTLSRLEADTFRPDLQKVHLDKLTARVVTRMNFLAGQKGVTIDYQEPAATVEICSDAELIEQIITNLLDNAIKYSPEGSSIEVSLEDQPDREIIRVKDHGKGIPPSELPRIFERFYRVDKARSRKTGGTGLGLAIVKHLAEVLKAQVNAESTPGIGSAFSVTLFK